MKSLQETYTKWHKIITSTAQPNWKEVEEIIRAIYSENSHTGLLGDLPQIRWIESPADMDGFNSIDLFPDAALKGATGKHHPPAKVMNCIDKLVRTTDNIMHCVLIDEPSKMKYFSNDQITNAFMADLYSPDTPSIYEIGRIKEYDHLSRKARQVFD